MKLVNIFVGVYLMVLSTWNFKLCFSIAKMKTISFHYMRHRKEFIHVFCLSKVHLHHLGQFKMIKNNAEFFSLLFGLSPVRKVTCYGLPSVQ